MADDLENKTENKTENKSENKEIKQDEKLLKLALPTRPKLTQLHQVKLTNQKIHLVPITRQFKKYPSRVLKIRKLNRLIKMLNLI